MDEEVRWEGDLSQKPKKLRHIRFPSTQRDELYAKVRGNRPSISEHKKKAADDSTLIKAKETGRFF